MFNYYRPPVQLNAISREGRAGSCKPHFGLLFMFLLCAFAGCSDRTNTDTTARQGQVHESETSTEGQDNSSTSNDLLLDEKPGTTVVEGAFRNTTELIAAVRDSNEVAVEQLIDRGVDLDGRSDDNRTALYWAIDNDDLGLAKTLIAAGADVNVADANGVTPLILASRKGQSELVRELLEHGASVSASDREGSTALHVAAHDGNVELVNLLIEYGSDIVAEDKYGRTAFVDAAMGSRIDVMEALVTHGVDPNGFNRSRTVCALSAAAVYPNGDEAIGWLLSHGVNPNLRGLGGRTALHDAVEFGRPTAVELLLDGGADPTLRTDNGESALDIARRRSGEEGNAIEQLIRHHMPAGGN